MNAQFPSTRVVRTLLVDNYDSFTHNLFQMLAVVNGFEPVVVKNDDERLQSLDLREFDNVVISPGPGRPQRADDLAFASRIVEQAELPVLGVCLGHQAICHVYGAQVDLAPEPMHGRISVVEHNGDALFSGIPSSFSVVRYHSLAATLLPADLLATASSDDGVLMAVRHRTRPLWGVQFHPESVASEFGDRLLRNFRDLAHRWNSEHRRVISTPSGPVMSVRAERHEQMSEHQLCHRRLDQWVTPEDVFRRAFAESRSAFWLDSAQIVPGLSRFSYMGDATGPLAEVIRYDSARRCVQLSTSSGVSEEVGSVFSYLQNRLVDRRVADTKLPFPFQAGYVGYLGYEVRDDGSAIPTHSTGTPMPDAMFVFADRLAVFDHQEHTVYLVALVRVGDEESAYEWFDAMIGSVCSGSDAALRTSQPLDQAPVDESRRLQPPRMRHTREEYLQLIAKCQEQIREGESYEMCLTNQLQFPSLADPLATYFELRERNAAPFASYFRFPECAILSASPERFLRVDGAGRVEARPVKGTMPRGGTVEEDAAIKVALSAGEKERSENLMIVDLLRNDLGVVCEVGSVRVTELFEIETLPTLHQMVSTITGQLRRDRSVIDLLQAAFPGGSMTGAPKTRTMRLLEGFEGGARGIYSGAIGYLGLNGTSDWSIVIRTIVNTADGATVGTGGAITALSDAEAEYDETILKAEALRRVLMGEQ
jgi:para-aminobenzoate synthetase